MWCRRKGTQIQLDRSIGLHHRDNNNIGMTRWQTEGAIDNNNIGMTHWQTEGAIDNNAIGMTRWQMEGAIDNNATGVTRWQTEGAIDLILGNAWIPLSCQPCQRS